MAATFLTPHRIYEVNGVTVKDYFLTVNNPNKIPMPVKRTKPLIGITVHNTEAINQAKGTTMAEQYTRATVNGNMGDVRVHYYVDEVEAWHNLPDDWNGWHAADGKGNGNTATIAIEVIGNTAKAEDNAARLIAGLMAEHGLTTDNLYTHSHWMNVKDGKTGSREYLNTLRRNGKNCPIYILSHWEEFEKLVSLYFEQLSPREEIRTLYRVQSTALFADKVAAQDYLADMRGAGAKNVVLTEEAVIATEKTGTNINVGDTVRVNAEAKIYGTNKKFSSFVYEKVYTVKEIKGDRVVINQGIDVIGAVNVADLTRV